MDQAFFLEELSKSACYPGNPESIEIVQTHISIVCLADQLVYKIKKPVRFSFLDFSTLEKRKHFCEIELHLNRRLCPQVYREVVPLYQAPDGSINFQKGTSDATIVDYAVVMTRLPDELLMNRLLERDAVSEKQIKTLAEMVSKFHVTAKRSDEVSKFGSPENQRHAIVENFTQSYTPGIFNTTLFTAVKNAVDTNLDALTQWLEERGQLGHIIEGHGDLHSGNIFLTDPPTIFDCLEFNPEFRCGDVAVENAFLMMDLIYSGHSNFADIYQETYIEKSGDKGQRLHMPMLLAYQAMVRAKVAALTAGDKLVDQEKREHSRISVNRHLQLAAAVLLLNRNIVIQVCGLPGAGKSFLCKELSKRFGWPHFSSDRIRKDLAGYRLEEELPERYYQPDFSKRTYSQLQNHCESAMGYQPVLADANFGARKARDQFCQIPGSTAYIIWIDCDEYVVLDRLLQRADESPSGSDAGAEVYQKLKQVFEPPDENDAAPLLRIDGEQDLDEKVDQILEWLLSGDR